MKVQKKFLKVLKDFKFTIIVHAKCDSIKLTSTSLLCVIFNMMISARIVGQNETMSG